MAAPKKQRKIDHATIIEQMELDYGRTKNPIYIWEALDSILSNETMKKKKLPSWIIKYLEECALYIMGLKSGVDRKALNTIKESDKWPEESVWRVDNISPSEYLTRTLNILGFSKRGFNAYIDYKNAEEKVDDWFYYHDLIDEGLSSAKALEKMMSLKGTSDERSMRRRFSEARKRYSRVIDRYHMKGKTSA